LRAAYLDASDERASAIELETRAAFEVDQPGGHGSSLDRSVRCAVALEELGTREHLDAGAMNCHVPEIRFAAEPGIAPCLALGRETSRGVPWTCTGDVPTAIAMLTAKWLGAATLYHELESIDFDTNELAIANTGEHDLGWSEGTPQLVTNGWFDGDPHTGLCACFALRAGPATLVAFTPHALEPSGFRYVVAEGEITGRSFPRSGTPNGAFRFAGLTATDGFRRWALSGASHHSCASTGLIGEGIAIVADHLGVGCVRVSPPGGRAPAKAAR
jgi:L-arabinose isomerase